LDELIWTPLKYGIQKAFPGVLFAEQEVSSVRVRVDRGPKDVKGFKPVPDELPAIVSGHQGNENLTSIAFRQGRSFFSRPN